MAIEYLEQNVEKLIEEGTRHIECICNGLSGFCAYCHEKWPCNVFKYSKALEDIWEKE